MRHLALLLLLLTACARSSHHPPTTYTTHPYLLITLDAGHGGHDPGALSKNKEYTEKDLALATTLMVRNHLQTMGYRVQLTRGNDTFITLDERSELANATNSDLFISIHYNASKNREAHGVEVYTWKTDQDTLRERNSKRLADDILTRILRYTGANSRGLKRANYSVLRKTGMVAVLVEGGFVSNPNEMERLRDPKYLNAIAWGIAQGINDYIEG